ncbi:MAG: hypothetical protein RXN93_02415 [Thermocladium sp.]
MSEYGEGDEEAVFTIGRDDNPDEARSGIDTALERLFGEGVTLQGILNESVSVKLSDEASEAFRLIGAEAGSYSKNGREYKGFS